MRRLDAIPYDLDGLRQQGDWSENIAGSVTNP
jgi:hypothetical protein